MLHESPQHVHRFYQEISKLGRPEPNGIMGITTTMTVSFLTLSIYLSVHVSVVLSHIRVPLFRILAF
jgi:hypothetical protein